MAAQNYIGEKHFGTNLVGKYKHVQVLYYDDEQRRTAVITVKLLLVAAADYWSLWMIMQRLAGYHCLKLSRTLYI